MSKKSGQKQGKERMEWIKIGQRKKKDERGYSVNQYLTDILTKDLEGKKK